MYSVRKKHNLKCSLCNEGNISSMKMYLKRKYALFLNSKAFNNHPRSFSQCFQKGTTRSFIVDKFNDLIYFNKGFCFMLLMMIA